MFKHLSLTLALLFSCLGRALACPTCEKQQPEVLKGISHGAGPQSDWDMVIVWAIALIVALTFFFSVKWLLRPGEKCQHHIKRSILN